MHTNISGDSAILSCRPQCPTLLPSATLSMSLRSLGLEHPWLLTHPIFWTAQHLELVECHFQSGDGDGAEGSLNQAGIETGLFDSREHDEASTQMAEIFAKSLALRHKTCSLVNLLECNGSALEKASRDPPVFFFAKRPVEQPECTIFRIAKHCTRQQHQNALPVIGYFHYETLVSKRCQKLTPRPHPQKGYNGPVRRLCQRKLSKVTPQIWSQDPYLVCIMLSMAQSLARKPRPAQPGVYMVRSSVWLLQNPAHQSKTRLLVTTKLDSNFVHLFEAEITSELLHILDDPTLSMSHVTWPIIQHSKVSFQPYSTLQGRLMARLVGAQESLRIEPPNLNGTKVSSNKRKLVEENDFARRTFVSIS
ncbi:hypothetical protein AK830_g4475 [Neonectria ditissima]|uniref:Uncharacterized protein n=1 Tax=Neonectria ditissima TaxID=78410 RepID=A0A0P7BG01_9HYPO|nr:hypothetical protein AK830_g4475 [Neonectria ditissima]